MRRIELLIPQVQRATENERVGSTDGISAEEYYQYFTDGQFMLQRRILAVNNKVFRANDTFDASGSETYDNAPFNIFARNMVVSLEYSSTGAARDYRPLTKRTAAERFSDAGTPTQYMLESGVIIVNAFPASGTFRRTYNFKLPRLDKRRTTVASHTKSATALSALTLTTTTPFDADDYALSDYLTIVGWDGSIKMRGIPYTAVDSGTGVVTIQGTTYTFPTSSTLTNLDQVCLGEYATTHSLLDDQCEDLLLAYCSKRILMRDSSQDVGDLESILAPEIEAVLELYADDPDNQAVPVTNFDYFQDCD